MGRWTARFTFLELLLFFGREDCVQLFDQGEELFSILLNRNKGAEFPNAAIVLFHATWKYYNTKGERYVRCRTLLQSAGCGLAALDGQGVVESQSPQPFGVNSKGGCKLLKNSVRLSRVNRRNRLGRQIADTVFQAARPRKGRKETAKQSLPRWLWLIHG